jgi:hypothetical protein
MNRRKLQVFVSSTYLDLREERQAAVEAILKAGHVPAGMELFAAGSESQLETIRRWIDESDVFMLILGSRYGSLELKTGISYVELEYDYALSREKPVFAVVISEDAIDPRVRARGREVIEQERPQALKLFRAKVLSKVCSFFRDAKDIKLAVHETTADFLVRFPLSGWIRGEDQENIDSLCAELARVSKRNEELLAESKRLQIQLERASRSGRKHWSDQDLESISSLLQPIELEIQSDTEATDSRSFLEVVHTYRDMLVTGVSNHIGMSDRDKLLFFNVCPKLAVYELAALEKVAGAAWQRYALTAKGRSLLAYLDRERQKNHPSPSPEMRP